MFATNKLVFFFILLSIVVFHTGHIFFLGYHSYLDYDMGKIISFVDQYPGFLNYLEHLRFGQGIAFQVYWLSQVVDITLPMLKFGSYLFFIFTFIFTIYQVRFEEHLEKYTVKLSFIIVTAAIFIFFSSSTLIYLGSYGLLVYCQSFFLGAVLLYFGKAYIWSDKPFIYKAAAKWIPLLIIGTFIDIRFSFYLCMAFFVAILLDIGDWKEAVKKAVMGGFLGICLIFPIALQLHFYEGLLGYRANHVLSLFYTGGWDITAIISFLKENSALYLDSIVGVKLHYQVLFLTFLIIGIGSELRFRTGRGVIIFLLLCLFVQIIASLCDVYPFGGIRYTTALLAAWIYLFAAGVSFCVIFVFRKIPMLSVKGLVAAIIVLASVRTAYPGIRQIIDANDRLFDLEYEVTQALIGYEGKEVWCDLASEKIAAGYRVDCNRIVATWNYQINKRELDSFYERLDTSLSKAEGEVALYLIRPFEIPFFDPVREIFEKHSIVITNEFHGKYHTYLLTREEG